MSDDKKMNELSDDELEQAAGGRFLNFSNLKLTGSINTDQQKEWENKLCQEMEAKRKEEIEEEIERANRRIRH